MITEECVRCYKTFKPSTTTWAMNTVTDEIAVGRDPNIPSDLSPWYGQSKEYWLIKDVEEYEESLSNGLCDTCEDARQLALVQSAELCSVCVPVWFDEAYAGERWDDE